MYDVIIIGSGPGGYPAALRAGSRGLKVAVVEKKCLGGECLNWGCIPTKAYLEASSMLKKVKLASRMGIKLNVESIDFQGIVKFRQQIVSGLVKGIERLFKNRNIDFYNEAAVQVGKGSVTLQDGSVLSGKEVILAIGSDPREFDDFPFGKKIFSNRTIFDLDHLPARVVILGGGIMGVEFATFFSQLGSQVTVVEFMDSLLSGFSRWLSDEVLSTLKRNKVKFRFSDTVKEVKHVSGDALEILTKNGEILQSDILLVTVGRKRNTSFLAGQLDLADNGRILVDENQRTSVESVWAVGDAASEVMLAHNATFQGLKVIDLITRGKSSIRTDIIPGVVFSNPPFATVGVVSGEPLKSGEASYNQTGISSIKGASTGKVRIYADPQGEFLKGAEIYGEGSAELIMHLVNGLYNRVRVRDMTEMVYPHPTLSENILEACEDMFGESIHKIV